MHVHALVLLFLHFFVQNFFTFFVSLYKEVLEPTWETFLACLIVLDNLSEVYGCSVIIDFISTMLWVFESFSLLSNCFLLFYWFCVFLSHKWLIVFFSITSIRYFFHWKTIENNCRSFFCGVSLNNNCFL